MSDIKTIIEELAQNYDEILLNPKVAAKFREQGMNIPEPEYLSAEEWINRRFDERHRSAALEIAKALPGTPKLATFSIQLLYDEIRQAIIFGLNGAAITLSAILVEFILKYAAYKVEVGGFAKSNNEKWEEIINLDFFGAINRASKAGLLIKEHKKELHRFREEIRNPYNHYNIRKITESCIAKDVMQLDLNTNEVKTVDIAAKDNDLFQARAKPIVDAKSVMNVFEFADSLVRFMLTKISDLKEGSDE